MTAFLNVVVGITTVALLIIGYQRQAKQKYRPPEFERTIEMNRTLYRIAAVLAFIIGAMAIVAGGQVLLGKVPDYYVINWLPAYNFIMGVLTACLAAVLIWKNSPYAMPVAIGTFGAHAIVMLTLQTAYRQVVAPDSLVAMSVRLAVWLIILALVFFQSRRDRAAT